MDEEKYECAMQMILHAGNAKSAALMAIDAAADGDFEGARIQLKAAQDEMHEAHGVQFGLIQSEASGSPVDVNIVLVHAQDHLTMAILANDLAERMVDMYERFQTTVER